MQNNKLNKNLFNDLLFLINLEDEFLNQQIKNYSLFVGGIVRDIILLNKVVDDVDIVISKKINNINVNMFGCCSIKLNKINLDICLPRKEISFKKKIKHNILENLNIKNIPYVDVFRRDITINTLYADFNGNIIDPLNIGLKHLEEKIIDIVDPFSFFKDPSRIIRCLYYMKKLNFVLSERTKTAIKLFFDQEITLSKFDIFRIKKEINKSFKLLSYNEIKGLLSCFGKTDNFLKHYEEQQ